MGLEPHHQQVRRQRSFLIMYSPELKSLTFGGPPILFYVAHGINPMYAYETHHLHYAQSPPRPCEDPMFWFNSKRTARKAAFGAGRGRAIPRRHTRSIIHVACCFNGERGGWRIQHATHLLLLVCPTERQTLMAFLRNVTFPLSSHNPQGTLSISNPTEKAEVRNP